MTTSKHLLYGQVGGQHPLAHFIDQKETYGPHVVAALVSRIPHVAVAADLGAGNGRDLTIVKRAFPDAKTIAVEIDSAYAASMQGKFDRVVVANIEKDVLPLDQESVDLIIANQVLEHVKNIFWVFHEVSAKLKVGGHFLFGVPNIASLHNRLLLLFGRHPTQHKLCSAHVRPFSKRDTIRFVDVCFPNGYELVDFRGSQFYPFPGRFSRVLSTLFPTAAFSIFFLFKKVRPYHDEFIQYPTVAGFETNFYTGNTQITPPGTAPSK